MNTSMQELIKWINKNNSSDYPIQSFDIVKKAIDLLEKEKEQIIDAFEYGQINVNEDGCLSAEDGAQQYYNEKYQ